MPSRSEQSIHAGLRSMHSITSTMLSLKTRICSEVLLPFLKPACSLLNLTFSPSLILWIVTGSIILPEQTSSESNLTGLRCRGESDKVY